MNIVEECIGAKRIGITGHVRPDGDCVGACLSLQQYLRKQLPGVLVNVHLEKPAEIFHELKGYDEIDSEFADLEPYDVFFVLDSISSRTGEALKYFENAKKTINIDHHISNPGEGNVYHVVPTASSACEVLYELMDENVLDVELAKTLYTGIIHDCGVFQYSNTSKRTMEIGSKLINFGFDFPKLILETFYEKSYTQTQILGKVLLESSRFLNDTCIVGCISLRDMEFYDATSKDLDGVVNQLRNIKGIHCAVFMHQTGEDEYKVSLRSDELVDVSRVAASFGGGGHVRAAGCSLTGSVSECRQRILAEIEKEMQK